MKKQVRIIVVIAMILTTTQLFAQNSSVQTIFKHGLHSGGYGALTNKFTTIRGKFANMSGIYGGWFINHSFMVGLSASAVTNNIKVPTEFSVNPLHNTSYEYGQAGIITEYVMNSGKPVHFVFNLFAGSGFTVQYMRYGNVGNYADDTRDEHWFFVAEPGAQIEVNLFKWMRFSPGVSYRASFGSKGLGLEDKDVSDFSYSATLKFGRF
jgi:hypothetical protein